MRDEAIEFLAEQEVRRLVVAWPAIKHGKSALKEIGSWARAANVDPRVASRWLEPLLKNGVIYADGSIDTIARQYITRLGLRKVPRPVQPRPKMQTGKEKAGDEADEKIQVEKAGEGG